MVKWLNIISGIALVIIGAITPYRIAAVIGIIILLVAWARHSKKNKENKPSDYYRM
jgi:hypothetical protein